VAVTISYGEHIWSEASSSRKVIECFSYNTDGSLAATWKSIPGLPRQKFSYIYNDQGKLLTETYSAAGATGYVRTYTYDNLGRSKEVYYDNVKTIRYLYDELSQMTAKIFYKEDGVNPLDTINYSYTLRGQLNSINNANSTIFCEKLRYNTPTMLNIPPKYDGAITQAFYRQFSDTMYTTKNIGYWYDDANRLTDVFDTIVDDSVHRQFDAHFSYDNTGRFIFKNESTAQKYWGRYHYAPGSSRLSSIDSSSRQAVGGRVNFIYDPNGNMVLDRSKKMAILYSWQDLPVEFQLFDSIPDDVTDWQAVDTLANRTGITLASAVKMLYDAGGNRVLKEEYLVPSAGLNGATYAGGILFQNPGNNALVVFTRNGDVVSNGGITNNSGAVIDSVPSGALIITLNDTTNFVLDPAGITTLGNSRLNSGNFPIPSGAIAVCFDSAGQETALAAIGASSPVNGDLFVNKQYYTNGILRNAVADVNGKVVYEKRADSPRLQYAYANISSPSGVEGRMLDTSKARQYFVKDHLGSTRAVIQREGASVKVVEAMMYQAYGKIVRLAIQPDSVRMTFTTKEFDNESGMGLYYFGARYYDPEVGSFTSSDPMDQYWNSYSYCGADPINLIDPDGLQASEEPTDDELRSREPDYVEDDIIVTPMSQEEYDASWLNQETYEYQDATFAVDWYAGKYAKTDNPIYAVGGVASAFYQAIVARTNGDKIIGIGTMSGGVEKKSGEVLSRYGTSIESASRLSRKAAEAEEKIGIHGVSTSAAPVSTPASQAARKAVEENFRVHDTPTRADPLHRTVELPNPVTNDVAAKFNELFGRQK
jgi:RHS repeat-associated protein